MSSKGFELEATYNPTRNWRMKFTGSQTRAQDDRVSPEIYNWWQQRLPVWTSLRSDIVPGDGKGRLWWDTAPGTYYAGGETRTPQTRWIQDQWGAYWAAATNAGRPRTQMREYLKMMPPTGEMGTPEMVASAIVFLASDDAGYMNGAGLIVDGGMTAA